MRGSKFTGLVAGLATVGLLAGCSAGGDAGSGDQHVTVWLYPVIADEAAHKAYWDETVDAFEAENEGITVDYEIFPWANRDEGLQTAIAAKKGPDLVYLIPDQLSAYQSSIEPIGEYLSDEHTADILPNVTESITIDGQLMGAPLLTSVNPLICNAAAFDEAGVEEYPETWDDLVAMAPIFKKADMYTINYPASPENTLNMTFYPLLWQAGGSVFNDDGTAAEFAGSEGDSALAMLADFADKGYIEPDLISTNPPLEQTALAAGKVACSWTNVPAEVEPFWGEENIVVLPPLTDQESVAYGTVGSLAMLKDSQAKEAAGAFAEFATGADRVTEYLPQANFFSALTSTGPLYADDPVMGPMEEAVDTVTVGELFPSSREIMGILAPEIQAALLGQKSAQEALDAAATAAEPLLGD